MTDSLRPPSEDTPETSLGLEVQGLLAQVAAAGRALEKLSALGVDAVITPGSASLLLLQEAQESLRQANQELGERVQERSAELEEVNRQLREEMERRRQVEEERERLLTENRQQSRFLQSVLSSITDAVWVHDSTGAITLMNPTARRLTNYSPEQARLTYRERVPTRRFLKENGDRLPVEQMPVARALTGETVRSEVLGLVTPDGTVHWLSYGSAPITSRDGQILGAVVTAAEVTELREARQQLQEANEELTAANEELQASSQELAERAERLAAQRDRMARLGADLIVERARLRAIFDNAPVGILVTGPDGRLEFTNPAADRILGPPVPDGEGRLSYSGLQFFWPDGTPCPPEQRPLERASDMGVSVQGVELKVVGRDGVSHDLLVNAAPITEGSGKTFGVIAAFQDITPIKEAERERARLEAMKAEFMANVSHELRTPLSSILGYAELLEGDELSEIQQEFVQTIYESGQKLEQLIDELLDISRLESPEFHLEVAPVVIHRLVERCLGEAGPRAIERGLALQAEVEEDLPRVAGDPARLEQVLGNLLSNAIKFTPAGGTVAVRARLEDDTLLLEVSDTGVGIQPEDLPNLFERFSRGSNSEGVQGTGLGLYIVRNIVTAHRGEVTVESEPGKGSTFRVCLPVHEN